MFRNVTEFVFWFGVGKLITAATMKVCDDTIGNVSQIILIVLLFNYATDIGRSALLASQLFKHNI